VTDTWLRGDDDATALLRADGTSLSYGSLRDARNQAQKQLAAIGVRAGKVVAIGASDPFVFILAALATWACDAAVLPLDARAGAKTCARFAERAGAVAIVTGGDIERLLAIDPRETSATIDARAGLVLFTSGSSAEPKAVVLSRDGLVANVDAILEYLPIARAPRTAVVVPLSYSYGLVGQVLATLRAGGSLLLLSEVAYPTLQIEAMARHGALGLSSVPTSLRLLARAIADAPADARPKLAYVASAGAPLDDATRALISACFPESKLFNQYGLTEASPRVTALSSDDAAFARGSVGRPLAGVEVWAVDADGKRLPSGVEGELVVCGPSVMLGYLGDEAATARAFLAEGALRTADAGYVDHEGFVFVGGRLDGVVKCAGERVNVEEIASALRACEGVRDACVVAVPHAERGAALHAFVEASDQVLSNVRAFVRANLAPAKRPVRIVAMESLPRTSNGKVARAELPTTEETR
jgi:acyl-coenzyme A synthetase/AMP-(fatty) acid ligase